ANSLTTAFFTSFPRFSPGSQREVTVGYSKQKARARGKVIPGRQKNPHRLFQADGGLKEGNGIGEPYAHLADI
ncbi:MAG: hypothetical protein WBF55_11920, partial [Syntrophobacteria bacterium]